MHVIVTNFNSQFQLQLIISKGLL